MARDSCSRLIPAWQATRPSLARRSKDICNASLHGAASQKSLVVAQVALSLLLAGGQRPVPAKPD